MGLTNFPYGVSSFGIPVLGSGPVLTTGSVFFVSSTAAGRADAADHGTSPDTPFATIDYAIGRCTASKGDVIFVMPGHVETIAAAGGITCDVAGVSIIGLGNGTNRPVISWSATASTWAISAANVTISNINTTNTIDEVVSMFDITGAGCTLDRVDFYQTTNQVIQFLTASTAADQLTVKNCDHRSPTAANSAQVWFGLTALDDCRIIDNTIYAVANASTGSICISGAILRGLIARNTIAWLGASITKVIDVGAGTGIICDNRLFVSSTAGTIDSMITGTAVYKAENYVIDVPGTASALLTPAVGTYT